MSAFFRGQIWEEGLGQGLPFRFLSAQNCPAFFGREISIEKHLGDHFLQFVLLNFRSEASGGL